MKAFVGGVTDMQGIPNFTPNNAEDVQLIMVTVFVPTSQAEIDLIGGPSVKMNINPQFDVGETADGMRQIISRAVRDVALQAWGISILAANISIPDFEKGQF